MHTKKNVIIVMLLSLCILLAGCGTKAEKVVVVYTSVDQEYAEPILKKFEKDTGIKVLPVFDVEAAKTTGLVNRLIAEKNKPQADVFWSSEFVQTMLLKEKGVLAQYKSPAAGNLPPVYLDKENYWAAFGGRARVLLINTNLVPSGSEPKSIYDLITSEYGGDKAAIAYPMFGTTASHAAALYAELGAEQGKKYFTDIKSRKVQVVDGNSVVRDLVAAGQASMGLTDSDDAEGAIKKGAPVKVIVPDQDGLGTLVVPNTVALIAGARNTDTAKLLIDYLLSTEVERELIITGFNQVPARTIKDTGTGLVITNPVRMKTDFNAIYQQLDRVKKELPEIFVK